MGTVFEELVRKFNEENNEEAGEHWTPRDAVRLMAMLIFLPIADAIRSGSYLLYDGALGIGGMLTVGEETLLQLATARGQQITTHLYGQEINPETYAICKADMLLKGEGENADHIVGGAEWSTLSHDAFPAMSFDFMMSNPPYGKSWKKDLETMGGKDGMRDPRFKVMHQGEELSLVTRSSDGQLLFLANMAAKMNHDTPLGSRIAEVHNGSSLFTGDAGQGESNIRRWLIENDWLEAIVALPLNLFYNTGIATYIWVLTNRKPEPAGARCSSLTPRNGSSRSAKTSARKTANSPPDDIQRICDTYLAFKETPQSKIFPNAAFGYWKVTVERPLRLHSQLTVKAIESLRFASGDEDLRAPLYDEFGDKLVENFPSIAEALEKRLAEWGSDDEEEESEDGSRKKGLSEKKKRKLLDPKTWERDARLVEAATALRQELGGDLFADHNIFRDRVDDARQEARPQTLRRGPQAHPPRRELARRNRPARHRQDPQARQGEGRTAARPLLLAPSDGERAGVRASRGRRRIRARPRPPRHRTSSAARTRRHRSLHPPRSAALHPGRLDQGRCHQNRLRNQLHPPLLPAAAAAHARRNPRRHPRRRKGSGSLLGEIIGSK